MIKKPKLIMAAYSQIAFDGRVLRSIKALNNDFDIVLFAYCDNNSYKLEKVKLIKRSIKHQKRNKYFEQIIFLLRLLSICIKEKPDIVYLHDYYLTLAGRIIKALSKVKVVYDAHELIVPFKDDIQSFREKLFYHMERLFIARFDLIIAANEDRAKIMKKHYNLIVEPFCVKNIPDMPKQKLEALKYLKNKYPDIRMDDKGLVKIVYQGVITKSRQLDKLVKLVSKLPNTLVILIGGGDIDYITELQDIFKYNRISNVVFLGKINVSDLYSILNHCDFGLISYSNVNLNNKYCAPNKLYEYAALQLPMITTSQALFIDTFNKYKIGVEVDSENNESFNLINSFIKRSKDKSEINNEFAKFNAKFNFTIEQRKLQDKIIYLFAH